MSKCEEWLREFLKDGDWAFCDVVRAEAKKAGFNRRELKTARKVLGVRTFHQFDDVGATPNWFWKLDV